MASTLEVTVPDIGDFKDVEVIEVLVKAGDRVQKEQPLIALESDKATMEIPSPEAGVVRALKVKLGTKVSQGSPILTLERSATQPSNGEAGERAAAAAPPPSAAAPAGRDAPSAADLECDLLVLGAGPGGYSAAFRGADLGLRTVLVERYPKLGGVCLNVGCIPSKALLHTAAVIDAARALAAHGVAFGEPTIDLDKLRDFKDRVVGKLTGGLAAMAKARKVTVLQGVGAFVDPHHLGVETGAGRKTVRFASAVVATGSQAAKLPFLPQDPRIVDSSAALELRGGVRRMLVIGGGIIGLEMGTVYSSLGARLDVVEMLDGLMPGADRDLVAVWQKFNAGRFDNVMLKTKTSRAEVQPEGIRVWFEGEHAPTEPQLYDLVLVSAGRTPNGRRIGAEAAGIALTERGFIEVDSQMRTNVPNIFAIGDVARQPMLAHKAVHEGHVAAEAAAGHKAHFDARVIPAVAYTDPEIAWVGLTEDEAKRGGVRIGVAKFPWSACGRAIANGRDEGFSKLIFDPETHRVLGAGIVGTGAGDLISELAHAIEMGSDATDLGRTIHPHPTLSESVGMAAELFEGVCTDLPPQRRK